MICAQELRSRTVPVSGAEGDATVTCILRAGFDDPSVDPSQGYKLERACKTRFASNYSSMQSVFRMLPSLRLLVEEAKGVDDNIRYFQKRLKECQPSQKKYINDQLAERKASGFWLTPEAMKGLPRIAVRAVV